MHDAKQYLNTTLDQLKRSWPHHGKDKAYAKHINELIGLHIELWTVTERIEKDKTSKFYLEGKIIHDFLSSPYFQIELLIPEVISKMVERIEALLA